MGIRERWLVRRLQKGDREACRELIRRYHGPLFAYLLHLGVGPETAEDLVQETYARAWQGIGRLRDAASLRSWLFTIARNEHLQAARRRKAPETPLEQAPETEDPGPGILDALEESERDRALRRIVFRLDPDLRETVVLHYFEGLSLRETGGVLGIPPGTVKSRLNRALRHLRVLLEERKETGNVGSEARETPAGTC